jgi:hypothetical protein
MLPSIRFRSLLQLFASPHVRHCHDKEAYAAHHKHEVWHFIAPKRCCAVPNALYSTGTQECQCRPPGIPLEGARCDL